MGNDPKKAAAVAAVMQYIKTEEEAIAMQSAMAAPAPQMPAVASKPMPPMAIPVGLRSSATSRRRAAIRVETSGTPNASAAADQAACWQG